MRSSGDEARAAAADRRAAAVRVHEWRSKYFIFRWYSKQGRAGRAIIKSAEENRNRHRESVTPPFESTGSPDLVIAPVGKPALRPERRAPARAPALRVERGVGTSYATRMHVSSRRPGGPRSCCFRTTQLDRAGWKTGATAPWRR